MPNKRLKHSLVSVVAVHYARDFFEGYSITAFKREQIAFLCRPFSHIGFSYAPTRLVCENRRMFNDHATAYY